MAKQFKLFTDISELVTLQGASSKAGRNINESDLSIIKKASFLVEDDQIVWVGRKIPKDIIKIKPKNISLKNQIVIPGLVDCHTHMIFAGDRSQEFELRNQGKSYEDIARAGGGILSTVKNTRKATQNQLIQLGQKRVDRHLEQGVTTAEIKSGYGLNLKDEIKILQAAKGLKKLRIITSYLGPHAVPPELSKADYLKQVKENLKTVFKKGLTCRADIFIEKIAFDESEAEEYFKMARVLGMDIVAHVNQLNPSLGVDTALKYQARSIDHLNFLSNNQIDLISKSNTTAVFVPAADFYIKAPFAPARALIASGARFALASNFNPGSCPSQDLQFVGTLARLELKMTYFEVLAAFTLGGAYALGMEGSLGTLEVGKKADFVTSNNSLTSLFYQVGSLPFTSVWRGGAPLYQKK